MAACASVDVANTGCGDHPRVRLLLEQHAAGAHVMETELPRRTATFYVKDMTRTSHALPDIRKPIFEKVILRARCISMNVPKIRLPIRRVANEWSNWGSGDVLRFDRVSEKWLTKCSDDDGK